MLGWILNQDFNFLTPCSCHHHFYIDNGVNQKCVNDPDFTDVGSLSFGEPMDCNAFAKYSNLCADYGGTRRDTNGLTANEGE